MRMSETISELATALAQAQGQMEDASKDHTNPAYKSKYADLASVRAAIRDPLSKHGLSYTQLLRSTNGEVEVETILFHKSGEFIAETLSVPMSKRDAQGLGSASTYGRRFALMALVGIAPDDDDGNAAVKGNTDDRRAPLPQTQRATQDRQIRNDEPPRQEAAKPEMRPEIGEAASQKIANTMIGTLDFCESEDSLKEWVKSNKATTLKLTPDDRDRITQAYMAKRSEILHPRSEAAE